MQCVTLTGVLQCYGLLFIKLALPIDQDSLKRLAEKFCFFLNVYCVPVDKSGIIYKGCARVGFFLCSSVSS